jgi:hypothetical protein
VLLHWDGRRWKRIDVSRAAPLLDELDSIDAASADNVWASGSTGPNVADMYGWGPIFLRWDGVRWRQIRAHFGPSKYKNPLTGVVEIAPSGVVWTLHTESAEAVSTMVVRFSGRDGRTIDIDPFPSDQGSFGGASASDVAVVSEADAWAVGSHYDDGDHPLISRWTGTSWRHQQTSFSRLNDARLNGVSAIAPTEIWAVGTQLVVRYSC